MKYIIGRNKEHWEEKWPEEIKPWYGKWGGTIETDDEKIRELEEKGYWIEPDFEMQFNEIDHEVVRYNMQPSQPVLFATIGNRLSIPQVTHYLDVNTQKLSKNNIAQTKMPWICCYSKKEWLSASCYLNCIDYLHHMAKELGLKLVIIGHVRSKLPYYGYRSLTDEIINQYLESYNSIFFLQASENLVPFYYEPAIRCYEPYLNKIYYGDFAVGKWIKKLMDKKVLQEWKREPQETLYEDNFYERIPATQKIYVPLNLFNDHDCSYYNNLGLSTACIGKHYIFLYDERQKIDSLAANIKRQVLPTYTSPILCPSPIDKESLDNMTEYKQIDRELKYRGENVYIGIVGTQGVDYEQDFLRDEEGKTRIAYIWNQIDGKEGNYYTSAQINRALEAERPQSIVPFEQGETNETIILEIAAGKNKVYEGLATQSQFIISKIKSAPPSISKIYGGIARNNNVLIPDILIAINKMTELARADGKPLVVFVPYNSNITAHDGTGVYEEILAQFAMEQGISIIVPSGEEGDKEHHAVLKPNPSEKEQVVFEVKSDVEQVIGVIYMNSIQKQPFLLISPQQNLPSIRLDKKAISQIGSATVYSTGIQNDYQNGSRYILFSLNNMVRGSWQLLWERQTSSGGYMDLWLAQEELNPYVTLKPSSPFTTLGSNAAVDNVLSVAAFNIRDLVVDGSSGRGFASDGTIKPICASQSKSNIVYGSRWMRVSGTTVAGSILLGTIAMLYDKWQVEVQEPYANSLIMNNLILSNLTQFSGEIYPNRGQGYGVFEVSIIPELLITPID